MSTAPSTTDPFSAQQAIAELVSRPGLADSDQEEIVWATPEDLGRKE